MENINVTAKVFKVQDLGNLKAYATVTIGDFFLIKSIRVIKGKNGLFITMPSAKDKNGKYRDVCYAITPDLREKITVAILKEYNNQ